MVAYNGAGWVTTILANVGTVVPLSTSSPNAAAYAADIRAVFFASFSDSFSRLFKLDITSRKISFIGNLTALAGGATYYNGSYWYTRQRSDELRRVDFDQRGMIAVDVSAANMTRGLKQQDYGDIDFDVRTGLLVVSATVVTPVASWRELSSYSLATGVSNVVWSGELTEPMGQIAVMDDGLIFSHQSSSGMLFAVAPDGTFSPALLTTSGFTDIAIVRCPPPTTTIGVPTTAASTSMTIILLL
jgi:hypothetical protein